MTNKKKDRIETIEEEELSGFNKLLLKKIFTLIKVILKKYSISLKEIKLLTL